LKRSFNEHQPITPMKLQKLIYFLYALYLYKYESFLFSERFEVWRYGPVISEIFQYFKQYEANAIDEYALINNEIYEVNEENNNFCESINLVWKKLSVYSGTQLSNFTHKKETAWYKADMRGDTFLIDGEIKLDGERFFEPKREDYTG